MELDNGQRGEVGVVLSLLELEGGKVRLIMDDVSNRSSSNQGPWDHEVVVTWKEYHQEDFFNQNLSEEELASLGHYVIARLGALKTSIKR